MLFFTARYDLTPHIEAGKKARTEAWKSAMRTVFGGRKAPIKSQG